MTFEILDFEGHKYGEVDYFSSLCALGPLITCSQPRNKNGPFTEERAQKLILSEEQRLKNNEREYKINDLPRLIFKNHLWCQFYTCSSRTRTRQPRLQQKATPTHGRSSVNGEHRWSVPIKIQQQQVTYASQSVIVEMVGGGVSSRLSSHLH